jgi:hypothetical protein
MRDHERSEIIPEHVQPHTSDSPKEEAGKFPWQFVLVVAVIGLGIITVILKGAGVF